MQRMLLIGLSSRLTDSVQTSLARDWQIVSLSREAAARPAAIQNADLLLYEYGGAEHAALLRQIHGQSPLPILAVLSDEGLVPEALESGAHDFLVDSVHFPRTLPLVVRRCRNAAQLLIILQERDQLERDQQRKRRFLARVMHDLRTPLLTMRVYSQFLAAGRLGALLPIQKDRVEAILRNAERLIHCVESIQRYERLEVSRLQVVNSSFDLKILLTEVISTVTRQCMEKGISLGQSWPVAPVYVHGDRELLFEALKDVLENAVVFTPARGSVMLALSVHDGQQASVSISDTGCGMPQDAVDKIIHSNWNAADAPAGQSCDGLGLPMVKRVLELHGSHLEITSRMGEGTRVRFSLPVDVGAREGLAASPASVEHKGTVLIVDDDEDNLACTRSIVELSGYEALGANGLDEARAQLNDGRVDAILLDVAMEKVNGLEMIRSLKHNPATSSIPVIMVSGCADDATRAEAARLGAAGYVLKPFVPAKLLKELADAMSLPAESGSK